MIPIFKSEIFSEKNVSEKNLFVELTRTYVKEQ